MSFQFCPIYADQISLYEDRSNISDADGVTYLFDTTDDHKEFSESSVTFQSCFHLFHQTQLHFWLTGVIFAVVVVLGLLGNLMMLVFAGVPGGGVCLPIRPFLIFLSINDILMLSGGWYLMSFTSYWVARGSVILYGKLWIYTFPYLYGLVNVCFLIHIWSTVALTVERFCAVCYPMWHRASKPRHFASTSILVISVAATLFSIPMFFEMEVSTLAVNFTQTLSDDTKLVFTRDILQVVPTKLGLGDLYWEIYKIGCKLLVNSLGPSILLIILTVKMVVEIHRHYQMHYALGKQGIATEVMTHGSNLNGSNFDIGNTNLNTDPRRIQMRTLLASEVVLQPWYSRHWKAVRVFLARICHSSLPFSHSRDDPHSNEGDHGSSNNHTLIVIPIAAIFCYVPPSLVDVTELMTSSSVTSNVAPYFKLMVAISNILVLVDASCNFYIYWLNNKKFRKHCKQIIRLFITRILRLFRCHTYDDV